MLILKTVDSNLQAYGGFQWPASGPVECPDWNPNVGCGKGGLHGWANGEGSYIHSTNSHWLVVEVPDKEVMLLDGTKCKYQRGHVVFSGTQEAALAYMIMHGSLTATSNPGLCCFTALQCAELAQMCSVRARHAAGAAKSARHAADAAVSARHAADAAKSAEYAAEYAAGAAKSARHAADAAVSARHAADAAEYAAEYAAGYADEREYHRQDKLRMLGLIP